MENEQSTRTVNSNTPDGIIDGSKKFEITVEPAVLLLALGFTIQVGYICCTVLIFIHFNFHCKIIHIVDCCS
jgi:hypothetical protein